jgi:peptidoglycan/xylan/chitin deacetylase (PgdA/CDA1 family)
MRALSLARRVARATQVAARRAAMSFTDRSVILLYHRIAECLPDPHLLCVTPQHFAEHLDVLARWGAPLALRDLTAGLRVGRIPARGVVLTFDDGYADNLTRALPSLERARIPATIYASAGYLQGGEPYIDELQRLILERQDLPPEFGLHLGCTEYRWNAKVSHLAAPADADFPAWPDSARERIYLEMCEILRGLNAVERERVMRELRESLGSQAPPPTRRLMLSGDELRRLAAHPLIEIGSHAVNHVVLASLEPGAQADEIGHGIRLLEEALGRKVESFAYPYGSPWDVGRRTIEMVRELGLREACANTPGQVVRGSDPYWLPRFLVRDWDGAEFERQLGKFYRPQPAREAARE